MLRARCLATGRKEQPKNIRRGPSSHCFIEETRQDRRSQAFLSPPGVAGWKGGYEGDGRGLCAYQEPLIALPRPYFSLGEGGLPGFYLVLPHGCPLTSIFFDIAGSYGVPLTHSNILISCQGGNLMSCKSPPNGDSGRAKGQETSDRSTRGEGLTVAF